MVLPFTLAVSKRYKVPHVEKSWDWRGSEDVQERVVVLILVDKEDGEEGAVNKARSKSERCYTMEARGVLMVKKTCFRWPIYHYAKRQGRAEKIPEGVSSCKDARYSGLRDEPGMVGWMTASDGRMRGW
jgi:hypothetical protein